MNTSINDDMAPEYDLSKMKRRPNPYAKDYKNAKTFIIDEFGVRREQRTLQLDLDISQFFKTQESIIEALRSYMKAKSD